MALVRALDPLAVSLILSDNNRNKATTGFYLRSETDVAEVDTFMTATRNLMLPLTNARLDGANVNYVYLEDAPIVPTPESEVERKLVLIFRTTSRRQRVRIEVPSAAFGLESPGTDDVALDNALVAAFAGQIISGPIGANNGAVSVTGQDIVALERAYIAHRNRRVD